MHISQVKDFRELHTVQSYVNDLQELFLDDDMII